VLLATGLGPPSCSTADLDDDANDLGDRAGERRRAFWIALQSQIPCVRLQDERHAIVELRANLLGSVVTMVKLSLVSDLSLLRQRSQRPASAIGGPSAREVVRLSMVLWPLGLLAVNDSIEQSSTCRCAEDY